MIEPRGHNSEVDPITFAVILNRLNSIAQEMTLTVEFTAWSSTLSMARDFSCAIYDAEPRQICTFDALPIHTGSMHLALSDIAQTFAGDLRDGDIILHNSPYRGGTHVGDLMVAAPIFFDGELVFWIGSKGHQMDVGAALPTSANAQAHDVFDEGLHIPPTKIFDGGRPRVDVIDFYLANLRQPELLRGDLFSLCGSLGKGRVGLLELAEAHGLAELRRYIDEIVDYADRRMSAAITAMPDGVYHAEGWVDTDGRSEQDLRIMVEVKIEDDQVYIDYTGSAPQTSTGVNGSYATSQAAPVIPFLYYIPTDIPHNAGCFKHIVTYSPPGTICNAVYPASTAVATCLPSDAMHDSINKALAEAVPDLVAAGGPRTANTVMIHGIDGRTGKPWSTLMFNGMGGGGAAKGVDGWPLIGTLAGLGGLKAQSVEQMELLYPLLVEQMEIEPESMGFGEWIGGPGIRTSTRPEYARFDSVNTHGDGARNPPHGILGGTPGHGGGHYVELQDGGPRRFVSTIGTFDVELSERYVGVSTGGGGYGRPDNRDVEAVRRDVRDQIITRASAEEVFGVVLSEDVDPAVDVDATSARRDLLRRVERPVVEPTVPGASTWLQRTMRPQDEYLLNPMPH